MAQDPQPIDSDDTLRRAVATMPDGFLSLDDDWVVRFANPAAESLFGLAADQFEGRTLWSLFPDERDLEAWRPLLRAGGERQPVEMVVPTPGLGRWVEVRALPGDDHLSVYLHDVTVRRAAQAEAEEGRARLAFLAEVSQVLDSSPDHVTALERVAELSVPLLGDTCIVDLYEPEGGRAVGIAAIDAGARSRLRELRRRWPPSPRRPVPSQRVRGTGLTEVFDPFPRSMWEDLAQDDEHLEALVGIGLTSGITVPLVAPGGAVGALSLGMLGERRHSSGDIALAEDLGRRAGLAIENARQHDSRAAVARALQARLLPPTLADVPRLDVAARYVAAGGLDVGGDFYDLFHIDDEDRWLAVIGDVSGKGADAAAMTGLLRHTLRAVAPYDPAPDALLRAMNRALLRESGLEQFCTVLVGGIAVVAGGINVTLANGGHPPPLLLRADRSLSEVGRSGTLVGAFPVIDAPVDTVLLRPGDALVLYTDGVTERRIGGTFLGDDGLRALVTGSSATDAAAIADTIAAAVASTGDDLATDDMALLVLVAR